jgi:hypothetical protein
MADLKKKGKCLKNHDCTDINCKLWHDCTISYRSPLLVKKQNKQKYIKKTQKLENDQKPKSINCLCTNDCNCTDANCNLWHNSTYSNLSPVHFQFCNLDSYCKDKNCNFWHESTKSITSPINFKTNINEENNNTYSSQSNQSQINNKKSLNYECTNICEFDYACNNPNCHRWHKCNNSYISPILYSNFFNTNT